MLETSVIPIEYDDNSQETAKQLKKILDANQMIFQIFFAGHNKISFLDTAEEGTLSISSIDELKKLLSNVSYAYMDMLKHQVYTTGGEDIDAIFLKMMLLDVIFSKKASDIPSQETLEISDNINAIYALIGISYYEEQKQPEKLIDFIFNPTVEEKEKIFNWLKKKQRYNLLNILLEEEHQKMLDLEDLEHDSYLRTHLEELLELSEIELSERFKSKEKATDLPRLSEKELDKLCIEFFIQIDPSLKWLKLYNKLKQNKGILYGEKFPDSCSDWGCVETTDGIYIYAPLDGTIRDFMYFIHEFAHYVTLLHKKTGEFIPSALQEFPPIFFEKCATAFLRQKGYNEESICSLDEERRQSTIDNKSDISPSLRYLIQYIKDGPITFETEKSKMDHIRENIPDDLPDEMQELLNALMSTQDEENVHIKIDAETAFLLEHPNCLFDEFPYIVGYDLAIKTLEKLPDDPMIMYTVLNITENLTRETTAEVIRKLGLSQTEFSSKPSPPQQYVKKNPNKQN